ncbi:hypothetical protein BAE44_0022566 [Dichanthelium oligosanthes]|uniref:Uncharacterized protein n=1 Tax=Dichanthelium oligosanthes TaxID=888268 RepID=A0A1E5UU56_9POAL|nr:hypothetical protein BAE44_0022566 [Dichanthelium oligosanthes]
MEGSFPSAQIFASKKQKGLEVHYNKLDKRVHNVIRILKPHLGIQPENVEEKF